MKFITYFFRGLCERGTGDNYAWRNGFSENSPTGGETFPWMTASECRQDAKNRGCTARFIDTTIEPTTKKPE